MLRRSSLYIALVFLVFSCVDPGQTEEQSGKVWVDLYARYLVLDQQYKVEATFLKGDTLPAASSFRPEGAIFFGERDLRARQLSSDLIRYQLDFQGDFKAEESFRVEDKSLGLSDFEVSWKEVGTFSVKDGQMSKSTGGELLFDSNIDLADMDELVILITDADKQSESFYVEGPFSTDRIAIAPATLANLKAGSGSVYLVRKNKGTRIDKRTTLNYQVEFYSNTVDLTIVE